MAWSLLSSVGWIGRALEAAQSIVAAFKPETRDEARTGAQLPAGVAGDTLWNPLPASYKTYREMRKQPTLALARAFVIAPVVAATWTVEADDDAPAGAKELIEQELLPIREPMLQTALEGGLDFGWAPFEKVFKVREDGRIGLRKMKPLIQDITTIRVLRETGAFAGFEQPAVNGVDKVVLDAPYCWLASFRVEGTNWYGQSLLENCRNDYNAWKNSEAAAAAYDEKVAGARWALWYPPGATPTSVDGEPEDNAAIAQRVLARLKAGGSVMLPRRTEDVPTDTTGPAKNAWEVDFLADPSPRQGEFVTRQKYQDALLVRGLLMPERAVLEGQFGTKAEAGVHADLAVTQRELEHRHVTRLAQWHIVDQLLAINFGEKMRGKVRLVANPLADEKAGWLRQLYQALLANPTAAIEALSRLDWDWLAQSVGVKQLDEPREIERGPKLEEDDPLADEAGKLLAAARGS